MKATLDWSHNLLSDNERVLFGRLSVFAGGWTLEAAEAVCSGSGIEEEDVLDLLGGLVDKSLVVAGTAAGDAVRYRMLEPIRQHAREKLEESGEVDEVQNRHTAFFLALAEEAELDGPEQRLWVERLEVEHDNLREALSWTLKRGQAELGLRFGAALWRFWFAQGYLSEGIRSLEEVLAFSDLAASSVRAKALEGIGWLVQVQGDTEHAKAAYEEMLTLSRELGDKGNIATALNSLGALAVAQGDNERARALLEENLSVLGELDEGNTSIILKRFHVIGLLGMLVLNDEGDPARATALWEESLALAQEAGDRYRVGIMLSNLGYAALLMGNHERATSLCEEALALAYELGSAGVEIVPEASVNLGLAAVGQGNYTRSEISFRKALAVSQEAKKKPTVINALEGLASLAGAVGEAARAAHLWGAAEEARRDTGIALPPGDRALHDPYLATARTRLGEVAWEEALAKGRAMSLEGAAEYAIAKESDSAARTYAAPEEFSADEQPVTLTPRVNQVALLVTQEFTNREIASTLTLSEHTVATHVRNVLKKLGLRSRTQVSAWFRERQPLP